MLCKFLFHKCYTFVVRQKPILLCIYCILTRDIPSVLWYCWLSLLTSKNRLPYNLYCVGGDVKHCSLTHSLLTRVHRRWSSLFYSSRLCGLKIFYTIWPLQWQTMQPSGPRWANVLLTKKSTCGSTVQVERFHTHQSVRLVWRHQWPR